MILVDFLSLSQVSKVISDISSLVGNISRQQWLNKMNDIQCISGIAGGEEGNIFNNRLNTENAYLLFMVGVVSVLQGAWKFCS